MDRKKEKERGRRKGEEGRTIEKKNRRSER